MDHEVRDETTRRFIAALRKVEQDGDLDGLAGLFTDDAEVLSIDGHGPRQGQDGIRELFREYVGQFDRLSTTFTQVTEGENRSALEWTTDAVRPGGHEVTYTGVTVIDRDGERCTGFRTIYDSARLMQKVAP
ncbi:nuclear transport factor 2 family protein [Aquipuribacter sp. SD81]|uniref:nuclear transport factor 2 family protein n=1 Tax=Aquipuribacter sp. SD81 TaxID=3127703 RepID=UPI00301B5C42